MKSCLGIIQPNILVSRCLFLGLSLLFVSCAGRTYRPESIDAKMQRYEGQQAQVAVQRWQVDASYFSHPAVSSARRPTAESTTPPVKITRPLAQIYFLSLVEQYYQIGQFLPETTPPLKICANFHDVLVREALYPPPAKKALALPAVTVMQQRPFLYPLSQLPLESAEASPTLLNFPESDAATMTAAAYQALRGQQERIFAELWQLCDAESGRSVNSDNFVNLVRFQAQHPLRPSAENVAVLFKIFPLSNWALLDSLSTQNTSPTAGIYSEQVLQALHVPWFKDYLQAQKAQRAVAAVQTENMPD